MKYRIIFILLSILCYTHTADSQRVILDYGIIMNEGSPYVFGATQPTGLSEQQWDQLKKQGFTFARSQADLTKLVPCSSPQAYKKNRDGCADPQNWSWSKGIYGENFVERAGSRDMKVCLTIKNARWNRYDGAPDDEETMPKDLEVWSDIVTKIINHYMGTISYVEFFNEVDREPQFLIDGSPYTRKEGYKKVVLTGLEAIQSSDYPDTPGGGPASARVGIEPIQWLLEDPEIRPKLGVITFHDFDNPHHPHEAINFYQRQMIKYGVDIPIIRSSTIPEFDRNGGLPGTLYPEPIAQILIGCLKEGLEACGFWEIQNKQGEDDPRYWFDRDRTVQTAHLIDLMSNTLKLGKGTSKIVRTSVGEFTEVLGAINAQGERVAVFANPVQKHYKLALRNPGITGDVLIEFYSGDGTTDPSKPVKVYEETVEENEITLDINMASGSVYGLKIIPINN